MKTKGIVWLAVALLLSASSALAGTTTQKWTAGWDNFSEPLNYQKSSVKWSVNPTSHTLTVAYTLVGATPSKFYQTGLVFFCSTFPATFGQFPTGTNGGKCTSYTKQGVTKSAAGITDGAIVTDIHGNGKFSVVIGPIASGTYTIEFLAVDGVDGCGGNQGSDFQSPGPIFGDATTITIP
jgi:hypothetical protein